MLEVEDAKGREKTSVFIHTVTYWWASATIDYYTNYVENLRKVTREDIKKYVTKYIKGKPAREVKEIQNVYTFQRGYFGNILKNEVFEQRNLILLPTAQSYKLRTTITGHEQNGEFTDRSHFIKVEGNKLTKKFDFNVWKECGDNPIYPQGGTWIFDRAGWCPGAPPWD